MSMSWGDFLDVTSKAQSIKEKVDKLDFIQIKNVCSMKDTGKRREDQLQTGRKCLQITYPAKNSYSEYIKKSQNTTM